MKILYIIPLVLALQGCYQVVNSWDIERAINVCGSVENIVEISAFFDGTELVTCKNANREKLKGG